MTNETKNELVEMMTEDNKRLRKAGNKLAIAAMRVVDTYDGIHRLALAVAEWNQAIADEGFRYKHEKGGVTVKEYKVVRKFPMDPPVIEASYDTKEEAQAHVDKARKQESEMGMGLKAKYTVETGDLPYEVE